MNQEIIAEYAKKIQNYLEAIGINILEPSSKEEILDATNEYLKFFNKEEIAANIEDSNLTDKINEIGENLNTDLTKLKTLIKVYDELGLAYIFTECSSFENDADKIIKICRTLSVDIDNNSLKIIPRAKETIAISFAKEFVKEIIGTSVEDTDIVPSAFNDIINNEIRNPSSFNDRMKLAQIAFYGNTFTSNSDTIDTFKTDVDGQLSRLNNDVVFLDLIEEDVSNYSIFDIIDIITKTYGIQYEDGTITKTDSVEHKIDLISKKTLDSKVNKITEKLGISNWIGNLSTDEKINKLYDLALNGKNVSTLSYKADENSEPELYNIVDTTYDSKVHDYIDLKFNDYLDSLSYIPIIADINTLDGKINFLNSLVVGDNNQKDNITQLKEQINELNSALVGAGFKAAPSYNSILPKNSKYISTDSTGKAEFHQGINGVEPDSNELVTSCAVFNHTKRFASNNDQAEFGITDYSGTCYWCFGENTCGNTTCNTLSEVTNTEYGNLWLFEKANITYNNNNKTLGKDVCVYIPIDGTYGSLRLLSGNTQCNFQVRKNSSSFGEATNRFVKDDISGQGDDYYITKIGRKNYIQIKTTQAVTNAIIEYTYTKDNAVKITDNRLCSIVDTSIGNPTADKNRTFTVNGNINVNTLNNESNTICTRGSGSNIISSNSGNTISAVSCNRVEANCNNILKGKSNVLFATSSGLTEPNITATGLNCLLGNINNISGATSNTFTAPTTTIGVSSSGNRIEINSTNIKIVGPTSFATTDNKTMCFGADGVLCNTQGFKGNLEGTADEIKTKSRSDISTYYLTFVDGNNTNATTEKLYTNSKINIVPEEGLLNINKLCAEGITVNGNSKLCANGIKTSYDINGYCNSFNSGITWYIYCDGSSCFGGSSDDVSMEVCGCICTCELYINDNCICFVGDNALSSMIN